MSGINGDKPVIFYFLAVKPYLIQIFYNFTGMKIRHYNHSLFDFFLSTPGVNHYQKKIPTRFVRRRIKYEMPTRVGMMLRRFTCTKWVKSD